MESEVDSESDAESAEEEEGAIAISDDEAGPVDDFEYSSTEDSEGSTYSFDGDARLLDEIPILRSLLSEMAPEQKIQVFDEIGIISSEIISKKEKFLEDLRLSKAKVRIETNSGRVATVFGANWIEN